MLVVDDEPQILRALQTNLRGAGYDVTTAATAGDALSQAAMRPPDAVILDLILPDGSGTDVCRELRTWTSVPILVLSAVGDEREKVAALDAGADDYVTKPFGLDELHARVRALLRRAGGPAAAADGAIVLGPLVVDVTRHTVEVDATPVRLTPREFEVLRVLVLHAGRLVTHGRLLRAVWGRQYDEEAHYLHVYMGHLRRKIEADPAQPRYLLTEPGVGYRLQE